MQISGLLAPVNYFPFTAQPKATLAEMAVLQFGVPESIGAAYPMAPNKLQI